MIGFSMSILPRDYYVPVYVYILCPYTKYLANISPSSRTPNRRSSGQRRTRRRGRMRRLRSSRLTSRDEIGICGDGSLRAR